LHNADAKVYCINMPCSENTIVKTITVSHANKDFAGYMKAVKREPVLITDENRPVAVTLSIRDAAEFMRFKTETGIQHGLDDVVAGRFTEFTRSTAQELVADFTERYRANS